jgi:hypothetical protein
MAEIWESLRQNTKNWEKKYSVFRKKEIKPGIAAPDIGPPV